MAQNKWFIARVSKGFTLIELLVVFFIITIISGIGLVSLRGFADQKAVTEAAADFSASVQLAKSRTQSQVKPTTAPCATLPLDGYRVSLVCTAGTCSGYTISPVCGGQTSAAIRTGTFPASVTVTVSTSPPQALFRTITGLVDVAANPMNVTFSGDGGQETRVRIFRDGRISR